MSEINKHHKARKRFGQNFLQDQGVIDDIITAIDPQKEEHLVEIGPGQGALTLPLLQSCGQLDAIELDRDLIPILKTRLQSYSGLTIHEADALRFDYHSLVKQQEKLRVIGNLPYNITTPLLFHLLQQSDCVSDMCFMLQREVVERICAQPGGKSYGRLSIMIQHQCQAELLFTVPPEAFNPIPRVESAIVYLRPLTHRVGGDICLDSFNKVVKQAFIQRRKTIANTLKNMISIAELQALDIDPKQRAETITISQYVALTKQWLTTEKA